MSTSVTFNGTSYAIPAAGELNWSSLSNFLIDVGQHAALSTTQTQAMRVATTTPVTVSSSSDFCVVTNLGIAGAVAVNLPAGANGQVFVIVDGKGDAATHNITITPNGTDKINGAANYVLKNNNQGLALQYSTTNTTWNVLSGYYPNLDTAVINPMTTAGDIIVGGASGVPARQALGSANQVLGVNAGASGVEYKTVSVGTSGTDFAVANAANSLTLNLPSASATARGAVTTAAQTIAGAKTFSSNPILSAMVSTGIVHNDASGNLTTSLIVNADVSASAAIAGSKLQTATISNAGVITIKPPTRQVFTGGTGTYTTPAGVAWLRVRMVGGGGGGSANGAGGGANGSSGTASTFGTALLSAAGGTGAVFNSNGGGGGTQPSIPGGWSGFGMYGEDGGSSSLAQTFGAGGRGGATSFGGGGAPTFAAAGGNGYNNTGGGGAGGGSNATNSTLGSGGGGGAYLEATITSSIAATYAYAVGAGGAGATTPAPGAGGFNGGNGGAGIIIVDEYYY